MRGTRASPGQRISPTRRGYFPRADPGEISPTAPILAGPTSRKSLKVWESMRMRHERPPSSGGTRHKEKVQWFTYELSCRSAGTRWTHPPARRWEVEESKRDGDGGDNGRRNCACMVIINADVAALGRFFGSLGFSSLLCQPRSGRWASVLFRTSVDRRRKNSLQLSLALGRRTRSPTACMLLSYESAWVVLCCFAESSSRNR